jgi:hypothetical protein
MDVIFFGPMGHFVMNKYLYYLTWNILGTRMEASFPLSRNGV